MKKNDKNEEKNRWGYQDKVNLETKGNKVRTLKNGPIIKLIVCHHLIQNPITMNKKDKIQEIKVRNQ